MNIIDIADDASDIIDDADDDSLHDATKQRGEQLAFYKDRVSIF
jgi:hypothetical protein